MEISDDLWFDLQFDPDKALRDFNIRLPSLPSDEFQVMFTAHSGYQNLKQAFEFYRHVRNVSGINKLRNPRLLDFGGGWGRVSRFFMREARPEDIYIADTWDFAIRCLRETQNPCNIIQNEPLPPIPDLTAKFDLIYSYSVFSHLSEEYFEKWTKYLLGLLKDGGFLAFTTMGYYFIQHLEHLHNDKTPPPKGLENHIRILREEMPPAREIRARHDAGEFQFYPIGGAGPMDRSFFGEAFIPRQYIERRFGDILVDFTEDVPSVDQSVVVLRKT
jgi:hypothetical protein